MVNKKDLKKLVVLLNTLPDSPDKKYFLKKIEKEAKPIKISSAKAKGRDLQKYACQKISEYTGVEWGNTDEHFIRSREMGQSGVDVILLGEARKCFPFSIECKNSESFSFKSTIEQVKNNVKEGDYWIIFHKRKGMNPIVIMDSEEFFSFISSIDKK